MNGLAQNGEAQFRALTEQVKRYVKKLSHVNPFRPDFCSPLSFSFQIF